MRPMTFPVARTVNTAETTNFHWETKDGTAVAADGDYEAGSGTVTFAPGDTSKAITVMIPNAPPATTRQFTVEGSGIVGGKFIRSVGVGVIPGVGATTYLDRYDWMYDKIKAPSSGYFGPATGPKARQYVHHTRETLIVEAPDHGHQGTSEGLSEWMVLESWRGRLHGDWSGFTAAWDSAHNNYVPSPADNYVGGYDPSSPADYVPEADLPSGYPVPGNSAAPVGNDNIFAKLHAKYGDDRMYLWHWLVDIPGVYGFHNLDGATVGVFMDLYARGMQESTWETIPHPQADDWVFGNAYGYLPLYAQNKPTYPDAEFSYEKQVRYTSAPDAEVRGIGSVFAAYTMAGNIPAIATPIARAKKLSDHLLYAMRDKYFREIGNSSAAGVNDNSCHFQIGWYSAWGHHLPESGTISDWQYRIGSSEWHFGYNGVNAAYAMAQGGGGLASDMADSATTWATALTRQIEGIRWLQSAEGPVAGGCSNSWKGRYETPTDGRQTAKFYGMYYTYSPVWHDPPSNNWPGFQGWGLERLAELLALIADTNTTLANSIRPNLFIILNRYVAWYLDQLEFDDDAGTFTLPTNLSWVSNTQVPGQTTIAPNNEGVYEYLPSLNWPGNAPDYAAFWNASTVPNPNLHCTVAARGIDLGVASCHARLMFYFAYAHRKKGTFDTPIPNSTYTPRDAYEAAKKTIDIIWANYRTDYGVAVPEYRADYDRFDQEIYVPPGYSGTMPNGDVIEPGVTFIDIRSFMKDDPMWPQIQAYRDGHGEPITYHRTWAQIEFATANAAKHEYFSDLP